MPEIKFDYDEELVWKKINCELEKYNKNEQNQKKKSTGISKEYIANMLQKGESRQKISLPALFLFARALKKPVEYFIYDNEIFTDFIKDKYLKVPYIKPYTNKNNELIFEDNFNCAIRLDYLKEIVKDPFNVFMFKVESDIMENTLFKGNDVLIDSSMKEIKDGSIFAFNSYEFKNIRIRRFYLEVNTIKLIADNKEKYNTFNSSIKDLNIIGKVIIVKHFL